ncbi:Asparagine synthetase [glutamine-hydrolyzing] 3 (plasmid) [Sulfitobacter indolifex]|uniref:asparagine synthase (glutamine-hydrolyzing) n=2 Tax=Sulfitobacter indolifex TaxID=225422 RepID=A0ABM9X1X8_9RHOB|nr:asparagine synthetase, putative [Sulfitobacter indolifex HEL-45]UOA21226.1 Asparagine synthetase [glutamine-hydrolyzing] 3 [Sulfitobacter indolifex]
MDGFAIRIPLQPANDLADGRARLARMAQAGWNAVALPESFAEGGLAAVRGRAGVAQAGPWTVIGLASLDHREALLERLTGMSAHDGDLALFAAALDQLSEGFTDALFGGFSIVALHKDGCVAAFRDHIGVLPFYFKRQAGALTCASDIRASLHLSGAALEPQHLIVADFLAGEVVSRDETAFSGLTKLESGHRLSLNVSHPERAINIDAFTKLTLPEQIPFEDAAPGVLSGLRAATLSALRRNEKVGAMLSGGLDSSSLVVLASEKLQAEGAPPLPALSFVYGEAEYDESDYIEAVNECSHTAPHLIEITSEPDLTDMPLFVEEQMDLFLAYGLQKSGQIYSVAKSYGITALLDGHGGDEVLSSGYDYVYNLAAERRWRATLQAMRAIGRVYGNSPWVPYFIFMARYGGWTNKHPTRRILLGLTRFLQSRGSAQDAQGTPYKPQALFADALRELANPDERYVQTGKPELREDCVDYERRSHLDIVQSPLVKNSYEILYRSANAQGILPLYPFYDRALVEFCLSMPSEVKLRKGMSRWVLRMGLAGLLPEKVRLRTTKANFTAEFTATVVQFLQKHPDQDWSSLGAFVDVAAAQKLCGDVRSGAKRDIFALRSVWRLVQLRYWYEALMRWRAQQREGTLI